MVRRVLEGAAKTEPISFRVTKLDYEKIMNMFEQSNDSSLSDYVMKAVFARIENDANRR